MQTTDHQGQEAANAQPIAPARVQPPLYFAVSPRKLMVMYFCTMGLYGTYWFYKNWDLIKERERSSISPVWRSLLEFLFCYSCFARIRATAKEHHLEVSLAAGPLTAGFILVGLLSVGPDPCWVLSSLAGFFLLPAQKVANRINAQLAPGHDPNRHFSGVNIATITTGGLLSLASVVWSFWPVG